MLKQIIKNLIQRMTPAKRESIILSNSADGTHLGGTLTYSAAAVISSKHLFGKQTTTAGQITLAGSGNISTGARAIGVITDEASTIGDPVAVAILGATGSTQRALAAGNIYVGDLLTSDTNSMAVSFTGMTAGAGTFYIYGIALSPAVAGDKVEFAPIVGVTQTK